MCRLSLLLLLHAALACQPAARSMPERRGEGTETRTGPASVRRATNEPSHFAGSASCASCHEETHAAWRSTSHSTTVLTSDEARCAGYPLPRPPSPLASWADVSYVIGGRERITYAARDGRVQKESYHHRIEGWSAFPSMPLVTCGPCHFTGIGEGEPHPEDGAMPGRWVERGIGCEACHGPGGRHVRTQDPRDITTDHSSRTCGTCHTTEGSVLPKDQWHETHDFVQTWNRDPHVSGGRFHSQKAFCARCHEPKDAYVGDGEASVERTVFSERRQNITCIGCHNPHQTTSETYARERASLEAPTRGRVHAYLGDDDNATSVDFREYATKDALCLHCHRGADRIELDHASASCTDCHNTFHANRGRESRIDHDANRPRLSCRPCHPDADRLMSIVFEDRDFLQPHYVHDLGRLPARIVQRHDFRYPNLARSAPAVGVPPPAPEPERIAPSLDLERTDFDRSVTRLVFELVGAPSTVTERKAPSSEVLDAVLDRAPDDVTTIAFHAGLTQLLAGAHMDAIQSFEQVLEVAPSPSKVAARLALALAHMADDRLLHARNELARAIEEDPNDPVLRYYSGELELLRREPARAIAELALAAELDPDFLEARYALGRSLRVSGRMDEAIRVYRELARHAPDEFEVRARLARLYKLSSDRYAVELLTTRESAPPRGVTAARWRSRQEALEESSARFGRLALGELGRALQLRPNDVELKYQVSEILRRAGELEKAESYFRWLVDHRPDDWPSSYRLGTILILRGRESDAVPVLERAIRAAPTEGDAYVALGLALARAGLERKAVDTFEQGRIYAPFNPTLHTNLGVLYARNGEPEKAEGAFRRSLTLATFPIPRVHLTHTNLALLYWKRGERDEALREIRIALHAYPDYAYAKRIEIALSGDSGEAPESYPFVLNDLLERFGEVTTVVFE